MYIYAIIILVRQGQDKQLLRRDIIDHIDFDRLPQQAKRKELIPIPDSAAKKAWTAAHTQRIVMNLNRNTDADILQKLAQVDSKQGYIKQLIRKDISDNHIDKED